MKKRRTLTSDVKMAIFKDLVFPRSCPGADYDKSDFQCHLFSVITLYELSTSF